MANSLKVPVKRTGTPVLAPSPYAKPTITLEEWESKAPLTDKELRSVSSVQKAQGNKPLPLKSSSEDGPSTPRAATPVQHLKARFASPALPSSSRTGTPVPGPSNPLLPSHPIQTPQQFYDWFAQIERSVARSQESHYRTHLDGVSKHLETCDELLDQVDEVKHDVDTMLEDWRAVESGGKSLKDASEELLDERDRLIKLSEDIGARLEYFQELERATRMLNHPGESLVMQHDFLDMVERVDICIDFLASHRDYHEAEVYLLRFRQCLTRAMTLIKMYFVGSLKALVADVSRRMTDKDTSHTAALHLLYTRFQSVSAQLSPLLGELERRTLVHPDELSSLLAECHSSYFTARRTLLTGRIVEEIRGLNPRGADLVELTRSGCTYLKQLCIDEYAIYRCFFNSGKDQLYQYLEGLCDYLYDDLRPRILHEARLHVLCDVCKVLQALMVLDVPDLEPSSSDEDDDDLNDLGHKPNGHALGSKSQGLGRLHIGHMLQSVLQDAQTRLFFKAQTVVQSDIRNYSAKPEDLDYPKVLQDSRKSKQHARADTTEDELFPFQLTSYDKNDAWYPTLKSTVSILSQLHQFVQPSIFNDIAQESLDLCRSNLVTASSLVAARDLPNTELDGQLFLVRHLLVLKEMAGGLNLIERGSNGPLELHHVADTLRDMLRTTNLLPYAFSGASTKLGDASALSMKERIDDDLRLACEHVIATSASLATRMLHTFMTVTTGRPLPSDLKGQKPSITAQSAASTSTSTSTPPIASPSRDAAIELDEEYRTKFIPQELPSVVARLRLYLDERGGSSTVNILLSHIQEKIVDEYISFRKATEYMPMVDESVRFKATVDEFRTFIKTLC
ncbi:Sec34-domain-containing protein [Schizopora paradoxa]|uniref:Conserved oligomeric Golgi complex subunit 3 n=1 Tax=Schizopora paradoxa TaxID=27342 RepID=A0A0H2RRP0_9AGAM|nr:Sec34-domain-containing protein [Schizopora paradoxa]